IHQTGTPTERPINYFPEVSPQYEELPIKTEPDLQNNKFDDRIRKKNKKKGIGKKKRNRLHQIHDTYDNRGNTDADSQRDDGRDLHSGTLPHSHPNEFN